MKTVESRFWRKVNKTDGCWLWTGAPAKDGYAQFMHTGRQTYVHRWSWEFANGPIPAGMLVCHKCDTPLCVNPDHLFLGTAGDNRRDCVAKGRDPRQYKTHCRHGHEYTPENTRVRTYLVHGVRRVQRACRTCKALRKAEKR